MSKITAIKNGKISDFSEYQWSQMPKNKYGWTVHVPEAAEAAEAAKVAEDKPKEKTASTIALSSDEGVSAKDAVAHLKELSTVDQIGAYVEGDERQTVIKAAAKRLKELSN